MTAARGRRGAKAKSDLEALDLDDATSWRAGEIGEDDGAESPPKAAARSTRRKSTAAARPHPKPRGKNGGAKNGKKKDALRDDQELTSILEEARYESLVDPYRGIAPYFYLEGDNRGEVRSQQLQAYLQNAKSPWGACATVLDAKARWGFSPGAEVVHLDGEEDDAPEEGLAAECGCPTVDGWARDELAKWQKEEDAKKKKAARGKKRKKGNDSGEEEKDGEEVLMIDGEGEGDAAENSTEPRLFCGERRVGHKAACPCDYNPFCLASLGGMIDRYRQSAAKVKHAAGETTPSKLIPQMIHNNLSEAVGTSLQNANDAGGDSTLRRSVFVDRGVLLQHISFLGGERDGVGACRAVQAMHQSIIFHTEHDKPVPDGKVQLSTPPGLRNLGATCYLNSQLQCLAQNLGFVRGLFSWTKPPFDTGSPVEKRMAEVLSKMQNVLARMRYGPDRVICTNEFAAALSLENDEMQDPNEFARLLFDRMQESFRQSAAMSLESMRSGLGELLPSVFGGTVANVTECFECSNKSERKEEFMDLTVPIVDAEEESPEKRPRKGKGAKKPTVGDTDVQRCLNEYLHPESLTGDNQYECSRCAKKCDATRRVVFAKLPPVLNIQLARYVFDKATFSKQKLSTEVLLPRSLEIPAESLAKGVQPREYVLCAVQNHLGTSAHGGHYVAEVMDWATGVWNEFNDEDVTVLENGPTSSFDPIEKEETAANAKAKKKSKVHGSEDAYNLFYVDKRYLSKQCESELQKFADEPGSSCTILADMAAQRDGKYRLERENQRKEKLKNDRLQIRRELILTKLFEPPLNLAVAPGSDGKQVWVDGHFLRRFFSCQDGLEDVFRNATLPSFLKSDLFVCEHQKLAPRTARKGKLLHSDVYHAMEVIVRNEYGQFVRDEGSGRSGPDDSPTLMGQKIVDDGSGITCKECGTLYQREARRKFELFQLLLSIHDELLAGNEIDRRSITNTSDIYVISRTFATSLRNLVEKKVKELKNMAQKKPSDKSKTDNNFCGGLDALDLSEVQLQTEDKETPRSENGTEANENAEAPGLLKGEDPTSKISCEHGCCPMMNTGNSVRLISADLWQKLAKVFPNALPHRFELPKDDAIGNCAQCYNEKEGANILIGGLREWKGKAGSLRELRERGKAGQSFPVETVEALLLTPGSKVVLHALHHLDVMRWRDAVAAVERFLKSKKKEADAVRSQLEELLFVPSEESQGREWKIRPLVCDEHGEALCLPPLSSEEDAKEWLESLPKSNIELLLEQEYSDLMSSLSALAKIIHGNNRPDPREIGAPTISIRCQKGSSKMKIEPQMCTGGCQVTCFADECTENGRIVPKSLQPKPTNATKDAKQLVVEVPKGPLCVALVHEIESNIDIDVAAGMIQCDVEADKLSESANGRPRRSRKARGGSEGGFPVHKIEMALDGNLAHFRLLLHQLKGKKLAGQRLFLLRSSGSDQSTEELGNGSNNKTLEEIVYGESTREPQEGDLIHLILSYADTGRNGKRMSRAERDEEDILLASLTEAQCLGWKDGDGSAVNGKKAKGRRQERGFQGTFLQSSEMGNGAAEEKSDAAPEQTESGQDASPASENSAGSEQPPQDSSVLIDLVESPVKTNGGARPALQASDDVDSRLDEAYEWLRRCKDEDAKERIISEIENLRACKTLIEEEEGGGGREEEDEAAASLSF